MGDNATGIAVAATLGLLINVPLMFEIPLVAALLMVGMGTAPAATLLFAAAAGGPITFWGLARYLSRKTVLTFAAATWVFWGAGRAGGAWGGGLDRRRPTERPPDRRGGNLQMPRLSAPGSGG